MTGSPEGLRPCSVQSEINVEIPRTDGALDGDTLTPYDFAMDEVGAVSSNLARALLARKATGTLPEAECAEARRVYDKVISLYWKLRVDASQRELLRHELDVLKFRLEACDGQGHNPTSKY